MKQSNSPALEGIVMELPKVLSSTAPWSVVNATSVPAIAAVDPDELKCILAS